MQGERRLSVPGVRAAVVRREVLLGQEEPRGRVRDAEGAANRLQDEGPFQQTSVSRAAL